MEKEELQKILNGIIEEKEGLEDLVDFFSELIALGEIVGRNRIDTENDIIAWQADISYLEG